MSISFLSKNIYNLFVIICIIFSLVGICFSDSYILLCFNSMLGSFFTLYIYIYQIFIRKNNLDFCFLFAFSLGFGYVFSTFTFLIGSGFSNLNELAVSQYIYVDGFYYSYAMNIVLLVMCFLSFFSLFFKGFYVSDIRAINENRGVSYFYWVGVVSVFLSFIFGKIGYRGTGNLEAGGVDAISALMTMLIPLLIIITLIKASNKAYYVLFGFLVVILSLSGRREILYLFISIPLIFSIIGYNFSIRIFFTKIHYIIGSLLIFLFLAYLFVALRVAVWNNEIFSSFDTFKVAFDYALYRREEINEYLIDTTSNRSFILNYFAILIAKFNVNIIPQFGKEFFYSFLISSPSVFVDKSSLPMAMEDMMHPLYGIPVVDSPNSVIISGLDDFYFFGVFLYPIILIIIYGCFFKLIKIIKDKFIILISVVFFVYGILPAENSLVVFFIVIRNIITLIILFYFIKIIFYRVR